MGKWGIPEKGHQNAVQKCLFKVASTLLSTTSQAKSEDSDDELEFNSDATVSEDSEVEDEEEVLVKEERVEEDANI